MIGLTLLALLAFVACALVVGCVIAFEALARVRRLERERAQQGERLADIERQLRRLAQALGERPLSPQGPAPEPPPLAPPLRARPLPQPPPLAPPLPAAPNTGGASRAGGAGGAGGYGFDWESLVGVQLFSWIAGIALALAAVFFLRYSIQSGWLQPPVRMAIGLFVGIVLLGLCELKAAGNYRATADALDAAGIAILFSTFFAAHALWQLTGILPTFAGLALVTAIAVVLSIRHDSLFIAGLGLIGGFLTPALLSTGQDNPLGLFGYLFVLNAGLAWVAYYKRWPWLTTASVVMTTVYQWGWVWRFMRPDRIPLGATVFLIFPILSAVALALGRQPTNRSSGRVFARTTDASALLPLLFAAYLVAAPGYGVHESFVFAFLLCVAVGLFSLAVARREPLLHVIGGGATLVVTTTYLITSYHPAAWPSILGWIAVFVLFYVAADWIVTTRVRMANAAGATAPALLITLSLLAGLEPATRSPWLLFATAFGLAAAIAADARRSGRAWLHAIAAVMMSILLFTWLAAHARVEWSIALAAVWGAMAVGCASIVRSPKSDVRSQSVLDITALSALITGELITAFAGQVTGAPVAILTIAHVMFLSATLWFATSRGWFRVAPAMVAPAGLAILLWVGGHPRPAPWQAELLLAAGVYAVFYAYPFAVAPGLKRPPATDLMPGLKRRPATDLTPGLEPRPTTELTPGLKPRPTPLENDDPWLAAVLASGVFFLAARDSLLTGGFERVIGLLPLTQAALMGLMLRQLLRLEPPDQRRLGRLALVAGAALAFVTLAVPLQLEKQWITIGWALEAAALAWLYGRIPHRGILAACIVLIGVVFARLTMNPEMLAYHAPGGRIFNWYLYTYLVSALAAFATGRLLQSTDDAFPELRAVAWGHVLRGSTIAMAAGVALLFALLNVEIADFYSVGPRLTFEFSATLAQDLTYTLGWALFGVALLIAGIARRSHFARIGALALLVATVVKGFLHDLARLGGLYRVFSFVGLAFALALVALALQKFVLRAGGAGRAGR